MSSVDSEVLEKQEVASGDECDGFISQLSKDGHIEQVPAGKIGETSSSAGAGAGVPGHRRRLQVGRRCS